MRCDRVNTASEIAVVREVKLLALAEGLRDFERQQEGAAQTVRLTVLLVLFEQFELFAKTGIADHLWGDRACVVTFRDGTKSASNRPDVLHSVKHSIIDRPRDATQDV